MRGLRAMIRDALASLKTMVWKMVEVGGRMILALVPSSPAPAVPEVESAEDLAAVPELVASPAAGNRYERIRQLAGQIDVAPADAIAAVGVPTASWLAAMSPLMISKVLCASDQELADHLASRKMIRGLLEYDQNTVADYVRRTTRRPAESRTVDEDLDVALAF